MSLNVKDIAASRAFYEKLGFTVFGGNQDDRWLILKSGSTLIGLFEGMIEKNTLTFNPGWDSDAQKLANYTDVREIQRRLKSHGIPLLQEVDETSSGPGYITVEDPDGNQILIDQHI